MSFRLVGAALGVAIALTATQSGAQGKRMTFESADFANGQSIPPQFSCDGPGMSSLMPVVRGHVLAKAELLGTYTRTR